MKTILIIDDDTHIGNMLEEVLSKEGYRVSRAYSGTEALLVLSGIRPDLILLDLIIVSCYGMSIGIQGNIIKSQGRTERSIGCRSEMNGNSGQQFFCTERLTFLMNCPSWQRITALLTMDAWGCGQKTGLPRTPKGAGSLSSLIRSSKSDFVTTCV